MTRVSAHLIKLIALALLCAGFACSVAQGGVHRIRSFQDSGAIGACSAVPVARREGGFLFLSAAHCSGRVEVLIGREWVPCRILACDVRRDVMLLDVSSDSKLVDIHPIGPRAKVGDTVTLAGWPANRYQDRQVRVLNRNIDGGLWMITSGRIQSGFSGGGAFNAKRECVGIISSTSVPPADPHGLLAHADTLRALVTPYLKASVPEADPSPPEVSQEAAPAAPLVPLDKPRLRIYHASWCRPCRHLHHEWPLSEAALSLLFAVDWIDSDTHQPEAIKDGVTGLPSFVIDYGQGGHEVASGYYGKHWLINTLTPHAQHRPMMAGDGCSCLNPFCRCGRVGSFLPPTEPPPVTPPPVVEIDYERITRELIAYIEQNAERFRGPTGPPGLNGLRGPEGLPGKDGASVVPPDVMTKQDFANWRRKVQIWVDGKLTKENSYGPNDPIQMTYDSKTVK